MDFTRLYNLEKKNILVIGDIMLDIYQYGECSRISPEAPVPVINFKSEEFMLGGAGNVLKNLVSFGAKCDLISIIGEDLAGYIILKKLKELNISNRNVFKDKTRRTTEKRRIVCSGQQLLRIDKEDTNFVGTIVEDGIINYVRENINNYDVILFSDYMKGVLTDNICIELIKLAKENDVFTLVDPKGSNYRKYENVNLIKPNLREAEVLLNRKIDSIEDVKSSCLMLKELLKSNYIVVTLAENGIASLSDEFILLETNVSQVFDVSGAGDTVIASLAICLMENYSLVDACRFSNTAASIVIKKFGSTTTTIEEVAKHF
jgi:D-beta-D-heptose 7-phosphate kinase/D-beta-D-heptose 1-phosphate adenosyltransferase